MGFSWAVFLAQTTMEDVFNESDILLPSQRVADGGPLPTLSDSTPLVHYSYVDDFGIIGLGAVDVDDNNHCS